MIKELSMPRAIALIPCYNSRKYIRQAVMGLLHQTRPLDLIVILNDCSTDNFQEEIDDLVAEYDNLIIHDNPRNLGRSGCRNEGFDCFDADFFFLNDADDISLPERVEKTLEFMQQHPNCGVCGGYVEYIDSKGKVFGKGTQVYSQTEDEARQYREGTEPLGLFCSTACIRGNVIKNDSMRFDTALAASEDLDLWNHILEKGWDVLNLPDFLCQYRFHDESICTSQFIYCKHMQMYVEDRLIRRRTNMPAISFDEYYAIEKNKGLLAQLCFEYPIYAEFFYRTGGFHVISGNYFKGGAMLLLSFIMQPKRIIRILKQRFGKKV